MDEFPDNHKLTKKAESYRPQTAERLMTDKIPYIHVSATIGEVEKYLIDNIHIFESVNYIYVVDEKHKLIGIVSMKELFCCDKNVPVSRVMKTNIFSVKPSTRGERAAYSALNHEIKAVPVVDKNGVFLGAITSDNILSILHHEMQEDFFKLGGIKHTGGKMDNIFELPLFVSVKHRIPWLIVGLLGGILAAKAIGFFEATLGKNIILAAFIPLVVYMSDAVGTQMEAFIIRDLAVNPKFNFLRYFIKQLEIVALIALIISGVLFLMSTIFFRNFEIGKVLSITLFSAIISSVFTGLIIPYLLSKFRFDPADASGPIATIIQDIMSVIIYFSIASVML